MREISEQIEDYFARQRLIAIIQDDLEKRIENLEMRFFLVENQADFQEFLQGHQAAQANAQKEIKATLKQVLDSQ